SAAPVPRAWSTSTRGTRPSTYPVGTPRRRRTCTRGPSFRPRCRRIAALLTLHRWLMMATESFQSLQERPMEIAAVFPTCEIGDDPGAIRAWAQAAEDLGYAHVVIFDHVVGAVHEHRAPPLWGPYDETIPFHEPIVLCGFLAAMTTHIGLATGVLVLPQRQTVLVAKQAAEIAVLSGNRLRLGV